MRGLRLVRDRLRGLLFRQSVLDDIDEELRAHIELETEANLRRGMAPEEARRAARRGFGSLPAVRDSGYDVRGGGMLETLWQDLRFGARTLRKSPSVTLSAVLTWALGIGATVAVFSVVKPVLLDSLPFPEPERIVLIYERLMPKLPHFSVASGNFATWKERGGPFERLSAFTDTNLVLLGSGDPERVHVRRVTDGYLATFGIAPRLGRDFRPDEDAPGHEQVAVLADGFWQRRFGGDPGIVGRDITLDGRSYAVIGVLPPDLHAVAMGENPNDRVGVFVPAALTAKDRANHGGHSYRVIGRLAPGATLEQARASIQATERELGSTFDGAHGWEAVVDRLSDAIVGDVRPSLALLAVAVAFVLLISCANVASLLLGRAAVREREIALRAALGAGRGRIVRQLATESVLLSVMGGALGLLLAAWGVDLLLALRPASLGGLARIHIDLPLLGFALGVSIVAGLAVAVAPALHGTRDLHTALKEGGRTGTPGRGQARVRRALVAVEVASCLLLLVGAGLLLRSLGHLLAADPGFQADGVVLASVDLPQRKYAEEPQRIAFVQRAVEELAALPGVQAVAASESMPLINDMVFAFTIAGGPKEEAGKEPSANYYAVTPDYFRTMGIRLVAGRTFTASDGPDAPQVAVINEKIARQLFPDGGALGARVSFDDGKHTQEIVGVVADVSQYGLGSDMRYQIYNAFAQSGFPSVTFAVRTSADLATLAPAIRARIAKIDGNQPVGTLRRLDELLGQSVARQRFAVVLLSIFAGLALLMAIIGIYGVIADAVTQRTHEIGVRMALGARRGAVLRLMMAHGLRPALAGVIVGLAGALATTHLLASLLYGVAPTDAATLGAAVVLILGVAAIASYLPARRATRVDPMVALRSE